MPAVIRAQGERASRRFIEFFTANIRNRSTRAAYARAVKQFFDWTDKRRLELHEIEAITVAAYIEQLGTTLSKPSCRTMITSDRSGDTGRTYRPVITRAKDLLQMMALIGREPSLELIKCISS